MSKLEELLNQTQLAGSIADSLVEQHARFLLRGPSGVGKSTIAGHVAHLLSDRFNPLWVVGDSRHAGTQFLAFNRALANTKVRRKIREAWRAEAASPLEAIPILGSSAAGLARVAQAYSEQSGPDFLGAEQQGLIFGLRKAAGKRRLLLVVDNLHWLDPDSASLILALSTSDAQRTFGFLQNMSILFIETIDQKATLAEDLLKQLRPSDRFDVKAVELERFEDVLRALGLRTPLTRKLLEELYAISGGHLEVAKEIVRLSGTDHQESIPEAQDAIALLSNLLTLRLERVRGAVYLEELLQIAACVGQAFTADELGCAFGDPKQFLQTLETAVREQLIQADRGILRFAHEAILAALNRLADGRRRDFHSRLAACFRKLRPGEYFTRMYHTRCAENSKEAQDLAFSAALQVMRQQHYSVPLGEIVLGENSRLLATVRTAFRLMENDQYQEAINILRQHYDGRDDLVQGELAIIIAHNYIKLKSTDTYHKAVAVLDPWRERQDERELWQRMMSLMVSALAFSGEVERASQLHSVLSRDLERASASSSMARSRLESLNRRAEMFSAPEIAVRHIERAVEWFGPSAEDGAASRNAFEYSASLVNLSGCLFGCGQFVRAAAIASGAIRYADELLGSGLRLVEPYRSINNFAVASYRAGLETALALCATLDLVLGDERTNRRLDRILVLSNRGVLGLLAGDTEGATAILQQAWQRVQDESLEDYYALFVGSNLAIAYAVGCKRAEALRILNRVSGCIATMPKWLSQAYTKRHELATEAVHDGECVTATDFDRYPGRHRKTSGPIDSWHSIGHGLLLSDIQVWSEP